MSNVLSYDRLKVILEKIIFIEEIINDFSSITNTLNDNKTGKPSILMHLIAIAEQFNKLKEENEFDILSRFDKDDLKGSYDVGNFIAHDYEGVNILMIERVIREKLPKIKETINTIIGENNGLG
jgi:uncharacterized protein with HEPN domain